MKKYHYKMKEQSAKGFEYEFCFAGRAQYNIAVDSSNGNATVFSRSGFGAQPPESFVTNKKVSGEEQALQFLLKEHERLGFTSKDLRALSKEIVADRTAYLNPATPEL